MIKDLRFKIKDSTRNVIASAAKQSLFIFLILNLSSSNLQSCDFGLELMRCRASLDGVIVEAGPKYHEIKTQADAISDTIERLREELKIEDFKIQDSVNQQSAILNLESKFRRRVACIHLSIKALKGEVKKYLCMGTTI